MHIKDDFSAGAPISQVPASWFASVARFINGLIGGNSISLVKHDDGTPSVIEFNCSEPTSSTDVSNNYNETFSTLTPAYPIPVGSDNYVWTANNSSGYGYVEKVVVASDVLNSAASKHRLWLVTKTYSVDGRLLSVSKPSAELVYYIDV